LNETYRNRSLLGATPKAIELQPRLATLMDEARAFVSAARQTPLKELELTFTIRAEEAFLVLADEMNEMLEEHAPKIQLRLITRSSENFESLREGAVQLDIGEIKKRSPEMKLQMLFRSVSAGVARSDHPLFHGGITAKRYAAYRQVNASRRGIGYTPINVELKKLKLERTVSPVVPSFQAAILAAANSKLIATTPRFSLALPSHLGCARSKSRYRWSRLRASRRGIRAWTPTLLTDSCGTVYGRHAGLC